MRAIRPYATDTQPGDRGDSGVKVDTPHRAATVTQCPHGGHHVRSTLILARLSFPRDTDTHTHAAHLRVTHTHTHTHIYINMALTSMLSATKVRFRISSRFAVLFCFVFS